MKEAYESMKFIRYGGLSALKQTHIKTKDEEYYHLPPKKKGFFAFPAGYVDTFLLTATWEPTNISNKSSWVYKEDGSKLSYEEYSKDKKFWIKYFKKLGIKDKNVYYSRESGYAFYLKPPRTFEYNGPLWHHLVYEVKPEMIWEKKGTWVKTSVEDYIKAFAINKHKYLREHHKTMAQFDDVSVKSLFKGKQDPYNCPMGFVKDELEVFIERL